MNCHQGFIERKVFYRDLRLWLKNHLGEPLICYFPFHSYFRLTLSSLLMFHNCVFQVSSEGGFSEAEGQVWRGGGQSQVGERWERLRLGIRFSKLSQLLEYLSWCFSRRLIWRLSCLTSCHCSYNLNGPKRFFGSIDTVGAITKKYRRYRGHGNAWL